MPTGIFKRTEKHKRNISEALKGRKTGIVPKTSFKKGNVPWNKNILGYKLSEETKKKMSNAHKGKEFSQEHKKNLSISAKNRNYTITDEHRERLRNAQIKNIERQKFNGMRMTPQIGKYEIKILNYLEEIWGYTILRQHRVAGYFIDGYCPMLNLAIEVDESYHNRPEQLKKDNYREDQIKKELNCEFLRLGVGD